MFRQLSLSKLPASFVSRSKSEPTILYTSSPLLQSCYFFTLLKLLLILKLLWASNFDQKGSQSPFATNTLQYILCQTLNTQSSLLRRRWRRSLSLSFETGWRIVSTRKMILCIRHRIMCALKTTESDKTEYLMQFKQHILRSICISPSSWLLHLLSDSRI